MLDWIEKIFCHHHWELFKSAEQNVFNGDSARRPYKVVLTKIHECRKCKAFKTVRTEIK